MRTHLDTHVAIWLAAGDKKRLLPIRRRLDKGELFVSPIVILEMEFLREIGRIRSPVTDVLEILTEDYGIGEATADLGDVSARARSLGWTRDPFDRLIVAHAEACRATLLTADATILEHFGAARFSG